MELTDLDIQNLKNQFIELLKSTKREGIEDLIKFLEKSDFFTAPSSTRFHGAYKGGLLVHSLNVYNEFIKLKESGVFPLENVKDETSYILCPLLHDICKTYFYAEDTRNVKNKETGQWEQVPYYTVDDKIPYGHGEKSVMMIEQYIKLLPYERFAIRWHMGAYSGQQDWNYIGVAYEKYPFAMMLHFADMCATHILETEKEN